MTNNLAFLGGFIVGGFTVFIVTAITVWKPIVENWKMKWFEERARRIVAEDNAAHASLGAPTRASWVEPLPNPDIPKVETHPWDHRAPIIDLTDIDLPQEQRNGT
jgi:hypothetical protein